MTFVRDEAVEIVTNSSGESTGFSQNVSGLLQAIHYTRSSTGTAMSTSATLTVTGEKSGITFLSRALTDTSDLTFQPRGRTHYSTSGAESGGENQLPVCNERLKFVVSAGGNGKTGSFRVVLI